MYSILESSGKTLVNSMEPLLDNLTFTQHDLWKDNIRIGKISLDGAQAFLQLGDNPPISMERERFKNLFERDAHLVELIYNSDEAHHVNLRFSISNGKRGDFIHFIRLFRETEQGPQFYGELTYWKS